MIFGGMTLERKLELLEQAICIIIDSISPMYQEIRLSSLKIDKLKAIYNELQTSDKNENLKEILEESSKNKIL